MSADLIDAAIKNGAKGIVIAGVGDGNMTTPALDALTKAAKSGVVVVRSTRLAEGITLRNNEVNDDEKGFVASGELNPAKSRVLLQLALTRTRIRSASRRCSTSIEPGPSVGWKASDVAMWSGRPRGRPPSSSRPLSAGRAASAAAQVAVTAGWSAGWSVDGRGGAAEGPAVGLAEGPPTSAGNVVGRLPPSGRSPGGLLPGPGGTTTTGGYPP